MTIIKAPFPYFGSKRKVAEDVWKRFGVIENYIEPFAGSLAVLLGCPYTPKIETVNDIDCFIPNFWRAVAEEPEKVAQYADYPVLEADLHARHKWLISPEAEDFRQKMITDPKYYDAEIAGWWVWGMNSSIGMTFAKPYGFNTIPFLSMYGQGTNLPTVNVKDWFAVLQKRLKRVRVCCGEWHRVVTPPITYKQKNVTKNGKVGIFLDPPYLTSNREAQIYRMETDVFLDVCNWAVENADNPRMRIAVCGLDGDFEFPKDWTTFHWNTTGGYSSYSKQANRGKQNAKKETIWFSPNCLKVD
jgi:DNA adenine methylase